MFLIERYIILIKLKLGVLKMAHKKGAGSTKNGRDSNAKRLGVKRFGGQEVKAGNIYSSSTRYEI